MSQHPSSSSGYFRVFGLVVVVVALALSAWFWTQRDATSTGLGVKRDAVIALLGPNGVGYQFNAASPVNGQERWAGQKKDGQVDLIGPADNLSKITLMFRLSADPAANAPYLGDMAQTLHLVLPRWSIDPAQWIREALPLARNGQGQITASGNIRIDAFVLGDTMVLNLMPMQPTD